MDPHRAAALAAVIGEHVDDPAATARLAGWLESALAAWSPPTAPFAGMDRIVAYAFGNRPRPADRPLAGDPLADQMADPGPVNAALAETVAALLAIRPVRVYAQWEVARFLAERHGVRDLVSIEPRLGPDGVIAYLTTQDVALAAVAAEPAGAAGMGAVAVVAHRDHAGRCVEISRAAGMDAFVAAEVPLPVAYDPQSGQPWTRRRDLYLLHDLCAQLAARRAAALTEERAPPYFRTNAQSLAPSGSRT